MNSRIIVSVFTAQQKVEGLTLTAAILLMAALTITNVATRSLLGISWAVTEEIIQMLMIVVCFIGLSYGAGQARHIRMSAIHDALSQRARRVMIVVVSAGTMLLCLVLAGYAVRYVWTVYELGAIYPATRIPYYMVYSVAPIGFTLTAMQYGLTAIRNLQGKDVYHSYTVPERDLLASEAGEPPKTASEKAAP